MIRMKNMMILAAIIFLVAPLTSNAQVLLSEIAWMGTDSDPAHEWIELYNFSASSTDLSGWTLASEDGSLSLNLSGVLSPHGVVLLERETDEAVPGITAELIYSGEMPDTGADLSLKDPEGNVVDVANGGNNWQGIGGINIVPKKTAQRTRFGTWVTAAPTPGLDNAQENDPLPEEETSSSTPKNDVTNDSEDGDSRETSSVGGSGKAESSLSIIASSTTYVGRSIAFSAVLSGSRKFARHSYDYLWNFGDMTVGEGYSTEHVFSFPGEYSVAVSLSMTDEDLMSRHEIEVLPNPLSLTLTEEENVTLSNESDEEVVLDGFTLSGGTYNFTFPSYSFLKPQASIVVEHEKIADAKVIEVRDTDGFVVVSLVIDTNEEMVSVLPSVEEVTGVAEVTVFENTAAELTDTQTIYTNSPAVVYADPGDSRFKFATNAR